jgi:hypothetical protein
MIKTKAITTKGRLYELDPLQIVYSNMKLGSLLIITHCMFLFLVATLLEKEMKKNTTM